MASILNAALLTPAAIVFGTAWSAVVLRRTHRRPQFRVWLGTLSVLTVSALGLAVTSVTGWGQHPAHAATSLLGLFCLTIAAAGMLPMLLWPAGYLLAARRRPRAPRSVRSSRRPAAATALRPDETSGPTGYASIASVA